MNIRIRQENGSPDFQPLLPLIRSEWPEGFGEKSDGELMEMMQESYRSGIDVIHYLFLDDRLAGFSRYTPWPRDEEPGDTAHTLDVAVAQNARGRRLGTRLMRQMMDHCRAMGYTRLLSRSLRNNAASLALHRSLGFTVHLETEDSIVWEAFLDAQSPEAGI